MSKVAKMFGVTTAEVDRAAWTRANNLGYAVEVYEAHTKKSEVRRKNITEPTALYGAWHGEIYLGYGTLAEWSKWAGIADIRLERVSVMRPLIGKKK